MITIYLIENNVNKKKYVGQTNQSLKKRFSRHCWNCSSGKMVISQAIQKYKKENFSIKAIDFASSLEEGNEKEVYWVNFYNCISPNGYNLKAGGRKFSTFSNETKEKISKSNLGKKVSEETKKKLSDSHKGYKVKESTKSKLSKINKGKKPHKNTNLGASLKNSKKYLFLSPEGFETEIFNMRQFCINNGLHLSAIHRVINKEASHHKGWKFIKYLEKNL